MEHQRLEIPLETSVSSLCWRGNSLIDWAGGNRVFELDGTASGGNIILAYRFDAAVQSASGRFAVIYERLGTKAVILEGAKFIRELNRSFYHADVYEFPIVLFEHPDGRELLAHCPDDYNKLEIEEVVTGKRITGPRQGKAADFFHSRLAVSPDQTRLLSAGWIWHPLDTVSTWSIAEGLADGDGLDQLGQPSKACDCEINGAVFIDSHRLLLSSNPDADSFGNVENPPFGPGHIGIFNLETNTFDVSSKTDEPVGSMLWLGDGHAVGFYESPKVIDVNTGKIVFRWPDIVTGKQSSSIIHHLGILPSIAVDPIHKRFAVASNDRITVIQLG